MRENGCSTSFVVPAQAGTQSRWQPPLLFDFWTPTFVGVTKKELAADYPRFSGVMSKWSTSSRTPSFV